jgi:hypothetical protein
MDVKFHILGLCLFSCRIYLNYECYVVGNIYIIFFHSVCKTLNIAPILAQFQKTLKITTSTKEKPMSNISFSLVVSST